MRSKGRKQSVAKLAQQILGGVCEWTVLLYRDEASSWFASLLLDEERTSDANAVVPESLAAPTLLQWTARELLKATSELIKSDPTSFEILTSKHPNLVSRWKQQLRAMYDLVKEPSHAG